jgi:hypothetical protein
VPFGMRVAFDADCIDWGDVFRRNVEDERKTTPTIVSTHAQPPRSDAENLEVRRRTWIPL